MYMNRNKNISMGENYNQLTLIKEVNFKWYPLEFNETREQGVG